jgi:hypothetical protein
MISGGYDSLPQPLPEGEEFPHRLIIRSQNYSGSKILKILFITKYEKKKS